jgi:hypothetical protein
MAAPAAGIEERDATETRGPGPGWWRIVAELIAIIYIAIIATVAAVTGAFYVMFPELGALSHDVFTRPRGTWANAPVLLAITPVLTGVIGIFFTRLLPYGYVSVLLTVGGAIMVMIALESPIAPAISAGLLPLVLGVKSWWYPLGIMFGTFLLAILSVPWKSAAASAPVAAFPPSPLSMLDDALEEPPTSRYWIAALMVFVAAAVTVVKLTGLRFVLFPPLVVIGFEMLGHPDICPWAKRPLWLPIACLLTAAGGWVFWAMLGAGPVAAALSMGWGILMLRMFDLHVPPALAVALLPQVMDSPTIAYPVSVAIGTLLMTFWFLLYQRLELRLSTSSRRIRSA